MELFWKISDRQQKYNVVPPDLTRFRRIMLALLIVVMALHMHLLISVYEEFSVWRASCFLSWWNNYLMLAFLSSALFYGNASRWTIFLYSISVYGQIYSTMVFCTLSDFSLALGGRLEILGTTLMHTLPIFELSVELLTSQFRLPSRGGTYFIGGYMLCYMLFSIVV